MLFKDIEKIVKKHPSNKQPLNFRKQSFNVIYILRTHELSKSERNVLYSVIINKFPVNWFSRHSFNFQGKVVISAKVDLNIEQSACKGWHRRTKPL